MKGGGEIESGRGVETPARVTGSVNVTVLASGGSDTDASGALGGRTLSREYELGEELGAGGFSTVRLGTHRLTGQQVAVKTLRKLTSSRMEAHLDASDLAMIRNEVMIVSFLSEFVRHPNVVRLVDVFEEDTDVHLVQELCKGGELFYRIELKLQQVHERARARPGIPVEESALFSERDAAGIVLQVASGLHELHGKGVIHRDLKPENLLYETTGADSLIKITDFGLSYKLGTEDPMKSRLLGSIDYIAPEVLTRRWYTKAGDMWSLGVITFILLSGSPPFGALNTTAKLQKIIKCSYSFDHQVWNKISGAAKDLISKLLVLDAQKRFTCMEVLSHPWVTGACNYSVVQLTESLEGISAFNAKRKFRAAALACIHIHRAKISKLQNKILNFEGGLGRGAFALNNLGVVHFSQNELEDLKEEFKRVCSNTTAIDLKSFQQVMLRRLPTGVVKQDDTESSDGKANPLLQRMFELFDTNKDGAIDFREFIMGLNSMQAGAGEDRVKMCFKIYDVDNSGWISREELSEMLASVMMACDGLGSSDAEHAPKRRKASSGREIDVKSENTASEAGPNCCETPPAIGPGGGEISDTYNVVRNHSLQAEVFGDLFERLDVNKDGKISYEEFKVGINQDPFLVNVLFGPQ